jgi:hypothetical protein
MMARMLLIVGLVSTTCFFQNSNAARPESKDHRVIALSSHHQTQEQSQNLTESSNHEVLEQPTGADWHARHGYGMLEESDFTEDERQGAGPRWGEPRRDHASLPVCPKTLVQECEHCPAEDECNCFRLVRGGGKESQAWLGSTCKLKRGKCQDKTGKDRYDCKFDSSIHKHMTARMDYLTSLQFDDPVREMWDVIYMRENACSELQSQSPEYLEASAEQRAIDNLIDKELQNVKDTRQKVNVTQAQDVNVFGQAVNKLQSAVDEQQNLVLSASEQAAMNNSRASEIENKENAFKGYEVGELVQAKGWTGWHEARVESLRHDGKIEIAWGANGGGGKKLLAHRYVRPKAGFKFCKGMKVKAAGTFGWHEAEVASVLTDGRIEVAWKHSKGTAVMEPKDVRPRKVRPPVFDKAKTYKLRMQDKMHDGTTIESQLITTLKCGEGFSEKVDPDDERIIFHDGSAVPLSSVHTIFNDVFTPIKPTGKSGARAMKSRDGCFRIKEVVENEREFLGKFFDEETEPVSERLLTYWLENPQTSFAKLYAVVNVRAEEEKPCYFSIMRNVFKGIPDLDEDTQARIFDIKGSDRQCKSKKKKGKEQKCGEDLELKEKDFDRLYPEGLGSPGWEQSGAFAALMKPLFADIGLMEKLKVTDYSIVMRVTPHNAVGEPGHCPSEQTLENKEKISEAINLWNAAPQWSGAAVEFCMMEPSDSSMSETGQSLRISLVMLDYLQDSTTVWNRLANFGANFVKSSKTESGHYANRLAEYLHRSIRPFRVRGNVTTVRAANQSNTDLYGDQILLWNKFWHHFISGSKDPKETPWIVLEPLTGAGMPEFVLSKLQKIDDAPKYAGGADNCFSDKKTYFLDCYEPPSDMNPQQICDREELRKFGLWADQLESNGAGNSGSTVLAGKGFVAKSVPIKEAHLMLKVLNHLPSGKHSLITPICLVVPDPKKKTFWGYHSEAWVVMQSVFAPIEGLEKVPLSAVFDVKSPQFSTRDWHNDTFGNHDYKTMKCFQEWQHKCFEAPVPSLKDQQTWLGGLKKSMSPDQAWSYKSGKTYKPYAGASEMNCAELASKWMVKDVGFDVMVPNRFNCALGASHGSCEDLRKIFTDDVEALYKSGVTDQSVLMFVYKKPKNFTLPKFRFPYLVEVTTRIPSEPEDESFIVALGIIDYGVAAPITHIFKFGTTTMLNATSYKKAFSRVMMTLKKDASEKDLKNMTTQGLPYIIFKRPGEVEHAPNESV